MKLQYTTWPEIEAWLEHNDAIVIPIGSTEQHGPNGLIGTDAICPEVIAAGMAGQDVLVAPTLSIGMAQHHLAFPGSITLRPSTLIAVIGDVIGSLAAQGFKRFLFLNGHGGNTATVHAAFAEIWADHSLAGNASGLDFKLFNWFGGSRVKRLSAELFGDAEGAHATPSEVSLTWYAHPDAARDVALDPGRAPEGEIRDAQDYRSTFPDGRIGSEPGRASIEHGERLYRAALEDAMEAWQSFTRQHRQ
ncbi:MAG: creatininase family protein [Wenzhouxiangellaceae bacterium]|nr:creatininase family protein [Wenzhouxiangellaceae bacterium]MBS3746942.1 creatininase family protein [Wenzhouxiangellaceae bacterium]